MYNTKTRWREKVIENRRQQELETLLKLENHSRFDTDMI